MTSGVSSNIANPGNFLRTTRSFPKEIQPLVVEINKAYLDIANEMNSRIIGVFGTSPIITGESWFLDGQSGKQQTLRQVYPFTSAGSIPHGIELSSISYFTRIYGTVLLNNGDWHPMPVVAVNAVTNQIQVKITGPNIVITAGATSTPIVRGLIVIEWLSVV